MQSKHGPLLVRKPSLWGGGEVPIKEGPLITVQGQAIWPSPCVAIRLLELVEKAEPGTSKSVQGPIFRCRQPGEVVFISCLMQPSTSNSTRFFSAATELLSSLPETLPVSPVPVLQDDQTVQNGKAPKMQIPPQAPRWGTKTTQRERSQMVSAFCVLCPRSEGGSWGKGVLEND